MRSTRRPRAASRSSPRSPDPDLLGATLDGFVARLGLPARAVRAKADDGTVVPLTPTACPTCSRGELRVRRARLLDAFGRLLDLDPSTAVVPRRLAATR